MRRGRAPQFDEKERAFALALGVPMAVWAIVKDLVDLLDRQRGDREKRRVALRVLHDEMGRALASIREGLKKDSWSDIDADDLVLERWSEASRLMGKVSKEDWSAISKGVYAAKKVAKRRQSVDTHSPEVKGGLSRANRSELETAAEELKKGIVALGALCGLSQPEPETTSKLEAKSQPVPETTSTLGKLASTLRSPLHYFLLAALVVVPLAAVVIAVTLSGDDEPEVASLTQVGVSPRSLATGLGSDAVWVADPTQPEAWWLEAKAPSRSEDSPQTHQIPLRGEKAEKLKTARPVGVGVDRGRQAAWVIDESNDSAWRIEIASKQVVARVRVGNEPQSIAVGKNVAWVTNADGSVSQIDAITNKEVFPRIQVGGTPTGVAVGNGAVWVIDTNNDRVWRIDPRRRRVDRRTDFTSRGPAAIAAGPDAVWVASLDGTVSRIDPQTSKVTETVDLDGVPCGVAVGKGRVWVSDKAGDRVWTIDPQRNETVGDPIEVEDFPCAIAAGDHDVWVANRGDSSVSRITP